MNFAWVGRAVMVVAGLVCVGCMGTRTDGVRVESPDGRLAIQVREKGKEMVFSVMAGSRVVVEESRMHFSVDGTEVTRGARVVSVDEYEVRERYAWAGAHSVAVGNCEGARVKVRGGDVEYTVDLRAYDTGVAFRVVVPAGTKASRVPEEETVFRVPEGAVVWHHDLSAHYEGVHERSGVEEVAGGTWVAPPLTFKLARGGYGLVTEANLVRYPGMALQADGGRGFVVRLAHAQPVARTYELRHTEEEIKAQKVAAAVEGEIVTPWRVVLYGRDLNELVNSDVVHSLCPPMDGRLFGDARWVRPGRAVWRYLDGGIDVATGEATEQQARSTTTRATTAAAATGPTTRRGPGVTPAEAKLFSKYAGELGFEHNILEGFWRRWSEEELRDVVAYSKESGVGVWLWEFSKTLADPEKREAFFAMCERVGVAGAKVDFFDSEAKETIDLYEAILVDGARHRVMLNFHGANKPTGLQRTYPNALVYEAVKGMESSRMTERARHEVTLPFTRMVAGPGEYTVVHFGPRRGDTTVAHQLASAAILSSPLLTYAANPKRLLDHPAVELIKSVPAVWDETIVLKPSEIGEVAVFARRTGSTWFLAVMNGAEAREVRVPLSFLRKGPSYRVLAVGDGDDPARVELRRFVATGWDAVPVRMRAGGGFLARIDVGTE